MSSSDPSTSQTKQAASRRWLYYPLFLIVGLIALDKALLLLPQGPQAVPGVHTGSGIALNETAKLRLDKEASFAAKKSGTRSVVVFGSSRSERFNLLKQETRISEYLDAAQKKQIMETQFLVYAQVGAQMAVYWHALDHLLKKSYIPDAIVLELGPELLELEHKNNHGKSEFLFSDEYDYDYYTLLAKFGKKSVRDEAIARLAFAGYALKLRPELMLYDYRGKPQVEEPEYSIIERYVRSYKDFLDADMVGSVREQRIGQFLTMYAGNYKIFAVDRLMDESLQRILTLAKAKRIPVLVYRPFVHPDLKAVLDATPYAAAVKKYARELPGGGVKFLYADQANYKCKYWSDASHYSTRCTPEIMHHLLRELQFFP